MFQSLIEGLFSSREELNDYWPSETGNKQSLFWDQLWRSHGPAMFDFFNEDINYHGIRKLIEES